MSINDERILRTSIEPTVSLELKDKTKRQKFIKKLFMFVDRQNEALYANNPGHRVYMSDERDRAIAYEISCTNEKRVKQAIRDCKVIDNNWQVLTNPFHILLSFFIREGVKLKDEQFTRTSIMFLTLSMYSSLQFKYFQYAPNENCMDYTINNLSNKFIIKKVGTLYRALEHTALTCHETYEKDLLRGNDIDIKNYVMNLRTRLNNFIKAIAKEYKFNLDNKKYLNKESDSMGESDEEENYRTTSNISLEINNLVNKTSNKFFSSRTDSRLVYFAARHTETSKITLTNAIDALRDNENKKVIKMINLIINLYLKEGNSNTIDSIKNTKLFLGTCLKTYSKSNLKDEELLELKKLLDEFMMKYCDKYSDTEKRLATKVSYRKALFIYMVLFINQTALH